MEPLSDVPGTSRGIIRRDGHPSVTFAGYESPNDGRKVIAGQVGLRRLGPFPGKLFTVDSARVRDGEHLLPRLSRV